jgi:predicted metal-binding membrane protein
MPTNDDFSHLDRAGQATAAVARSPRVAVNLVLAAAVAFSWLLIVGMAVRAADSGIAGLPGDALLKGLPQLPLPAFLGRFFAFCLAPVPSAASPAMEAAELSAMWFLMAVATMLPSAAPMVGTYCEIADTARIKREPAVHPLVLVAGYLCVWLLASAAFAALTLALRAHAPVARSLDPVAGAAAAAALAVAGLYQFSGMKEACLKRCRNPFPVLFASWSDRPARIFRLGLAQGAWCLGCCWALMLVMFAVGIMNLFWMALLGLFALVEKQTAGRLATRLAGTILLVWAAVLLLVSL